MLAFIKRDKTHSQIPRDTRKKLKVELSCHVTFIRWQAATETVVARKQPPRHKLRYKAFNDSYKVLPHKFLLSPNTGLKDYSMRGKLYVQGLYVQGH